MRGPGSILGAIASAVLLGCALLGLAVPRNSVSVIIPASERSATPDVTLFPPAASGLLTRAELFEQLGVRAWHERGFRGQGLKVAVLDSGFCGYLDHLGKALPERVQTRSFRFDGNLEAKDSQHGILCAEVIHALAPAAELLLANWEPENPEQFLAAVRWARREGARIISCSVIMPTWSDYEGHGSIHEELARILGRGDQPGDVLCFASAGNTALRHWSGPFRDGGDGYHQWKRVNGQGQTDNAIKPWGGERVSVELCCPDRAAFEVIVQDTTAGRLIGRRCSTEMGGPGSAVVAFEPEFGHAYSLRVRQVRRGSKAFHVVVLGGGLRHTACRGSIPFPGDGPEVIAVGAVDQAGRRLPYSSCGPKQTGTKPDFVASVPFPSGWRVRPFAGTSAAAPQAAALAAVLWSQHPEHSARQVRDLLRTAARPSVPASEAWEAGHGRVHLPLLSSRP